MSYHSGSHIYIYLHEYARQLAPLLFQGEESAASTAFQYFTDRADPGLGKNVAEGRRREFASFGWNPIEVPDPQDPSNFERSKVDMDELAEPYHLGMFTGTTT